MATATKKKRKEEAYPWKASTSSGHITNLKQSILEAFDIYGSNIISNAKVSTWSKGKYVSRSEGKNIFKLDIGSFLFVLNHPRWPRQIQSLSPSLVFLR